MAWSRLQYVAHTRIIHLDKWTVLLVNRDVVCLILIVFIYNSANPQNLENLSC